MKKSEIEKLVVGSIIRHRGNNKEYQIVEITEYDMTIKCSTEEDSRISTFNTLKRWYDVVEYEPQVEVPDVPNILVISEQLLLPAPQQMLLLPAPKKQRKTSKTAKTSNDVLLQALEEVLRGAKKADVCRKYNIPTYRFSRVLNFKYGRPSYRAVVYDMCKQYDKLDWIKNIELYEEA